jgi:hypothetical protein
VYSHSKIIENGCDVYGIDFIFNNLTRIPLIYKIVLVDPSNDYDVSAFKNRIIHLNKEINFKSLLKQVDVYIRPTIKDGDSVAVQEALILNVKVLASNIVPRPAGVLSYKLHCFDDFIQQLNNVDLTISNSYLPVSIEKYIFFCNKVMS